MDGRAIRVFVSSTFRDMQAEREELVKRVFPQVRRVCEQRGVSTTSTRRRTPSGSARARWPVTPTRRTSMRGG